MKKILSVIALFTVLGILTPAMAEPPHNGHYVHAGIQHRHGMHRPPMPPRHHAGFSVYTRPYYHHGFGWHNQCMCPYCVTHRMDRMRWGTGIYISF